MIKINTKDGKTTRIDLRDEEQAKHLLTSLKRAEFQRAITGVSVVQDAVARIRCPHCECASELACGRCGRETGEAHARTGVQYSITRPDAMEPVFFQVEQVEDGNGRGGERVTCFAGETRIAMMVHRGQPSSRISISSPGRQRYNPISG